VAEDFLLGFWVEEGGGRQGVEIWENAQYGFGDPNLFLDSFLRAKKNIPGRKDIAKAQRTQTIKTSLKNPLQKAYTKKNGHAMLLTPRQIHFK
jgi:hypothetical protein